MFTLQTPEQKAQKRQAHDATIELIFAGRAVIDLIVTRDKMAVECICGPVATNFEDPAVHHNFCPVARFFAAVETMRKAVL